MNSSFVQEQLSMLPELSTFKSYLFTCVHKSLIVFIFSPTMFTICFVFKLLCDINFYYMFIFLHLFLWDEFVSFLNPLLIDVAPEISSYHSSDLFKEKTVMIFSWVDGKNICVGISWSLWSTYYFDVICISSAPFCLYLLLPLFQGFCLP